MPALQFHDWNFKVILVSMLNILAAPLILAASLVWRPRRGTLGAKCLPAAISIAGRIMCLALVTCNSSARADEMTPAVTVDDIDAAQCAVFIDGKSHGAVPAATVEAALSLRPSLGAWSTGIVTARTRHFRISFKQPVAIGSICTRFVGGAQGAAHFEQGIGKSISILKSDAAYPGDAGNDDLWTTLPAGEVKALPPGARTRALRFTDRYPLPQSTATALSPVLLFKERYYNALNLGHARKGGKERYPEIWWGYWNEPQTVAGILFLPLRSPLKVEILKPEATEHPLVAPEKSWRKFAETKGPRDEVLIYRLERPVATRGLRLTGPEYQRNGTHFGMIVPLVNLGDTPEAPSFNIPAAPYKIRYDMPMNGFVAVDIHDKSGKRVRRLIAEISRDKGQVLEPWDLRDDNGQTVPPGEYVWKGIARPPFKNTYEITVNHSGQPPWPAPPPGKGGGYWLGDHSAPFCAGAMGDMVFLGCQVCEGGHTLIATDYDGNKLWGEAAVSWGFSGPERIATDGTYAYLVNDALVQRVDPQDKFKTQTIFEFKHTRELPGNGGHWNQYKGGAAARGDKLYVAYDAQPVSWLQPPFGAEDLDLKRSIPSVWLARGGGKRFEKNDKNYPEGTYDEIMRFYAALFTEEMPPTGPSLHYISIPSSTQAYLGEAMTNGPLANTLTVTWKKPITLGSILVPDGKVQAYALRPGKPVPSAESAMGDITDVDLGGAGGHDAEAEEPFDAALWVPLKTQEAPGRPTVAVAPEGGVTTQAVRFKAKRMPYALVMARRFEDVAPAAERVYADGGATPHGGWKIERDSSNPINEYNPAVMGVVWPQAVPLHGISLASPSTATMAVDVWMGPAGSDPKPALRDDAQWRQLGIIRIQIHAGYWGQFAGSRQLDFGENLMVRALRIRAIVPEGGQWRDGINMVTGPHRAGFDAIIAYRSLGGDPDLPVEMSQRIDEYQLPQGDATEAKLLRHIPLPHPGNLAFDKQGVLHAVSDGQIVTVPMQGDAKPKVVIARGLLEKPAGIAFDADGLLYVADGGLQVVRVLNPQTGKQERIIGTPGGPQLGPWDATRMDNPSGVAIDGAGKLWVVNHSYQPRLTARWSRDGKLEKTFMGPTGYGGGGWMDEGNRNVVNYNGMKFVIDWDKRTWKLESRLTRYGLGGAQHISSPDRAIYFKGRRYLAGDPGQPSYTQIYPIAAICEERNGIAVPLATAGNLGMWDDAVDRPELRKAFATLQRQEYGFVWSDKNGDGAPQLDEVQYSKANVLKNGWIGMRVGEDLSFNFIGCRLRPTGFTPAGVPLYDLGKLEELPLLERDAWTTADGRAFVLDDRLVAADGKTELWRYEDPFWGGHGFYRSGYGFSRPAGKLNGEHTTIGHLTLGNEEFFCTNSDQGDWFVFTGDGMLVGCVFGGPVGYGNRYWSMPEWEPGKVDLSDVRLHQEHYQGAMVKANDGKVYAIAGKDWNGVVRVEGLEALQRLRGTCSVTPADLDAARLWGIRKAQVERQRQEAKVGKMPYIQNRMDINASLDEWPDDLFLTIHDYYKYGLGVQEYIVQSQAALSYDENNLYVAVRAQDHQAARNYATDLKTLFKGGGAVDIQLGLDPKADPQRAGAVVGDIRILLARVKGEPVAMLYNYKVPGATAAQGAHFQSPVGQADVDVVKEITGADIKFGRSGETWPWVVEAAIPWKELGVAPPQVGEGIRGDVGLLQADSDGARTVARLYWSGKSQTVVSDTPSEARIAPALWGELYLTEPDRTMKFGPDDDTLAP